MAELAAFKRELHHRVEELPGVNQVEFIGSVANGNYIPGSSDLDVFVHGQQGIKAEQNENHSFAERTQRKI